MPSNKKPKSNSNSRSSPAPSTPQNNTLTTRQQSAERSSSSTSIGEAKIDEKVPASAVEKFPTLIGEGAVIAIVCGVDGQSKRFEISLSDSDFTSYKLYPGSLVSVSLASVDKKSFPLCSLAKECARSFGFGSDHNFADAPGSYFVIATLNCSSKVTKGTALLSSKLSCLMGSPAVGRKVFVFPTRYLYTGAPINGSHEECKTKGNHLRVFNCKEVYLELVHSKDNIRSFGDEQSTSKKSQETSDSQLSNGIPSSPKTPSVQTRVTGSSVNSDKPNLNLFDASVALDLLASVPKESIQIWFTSWLRSRVLLHGNFVEILLLNKLFLFRLVRANGGSLDITAFNNVAEDHASHAFRVDQKTQVNLQIPSATLSGRSDDKNTHIPGRDNICEEDARNGEVCPKVGGLAKEYAILKDVIVSSSVEATVSSFGLRTTKGVLLHGPPGTGKTSLVQQCANDAGVKIFVVRGPEIVSQYYGESEKALRDTFDAASLALPSMVFIDELDAIAPAREFGGDSLSERIVATLLNLMDGISTTTSGLCVVAATNRLEVVEPALRRSGRFGREIEIGVPSPEQRADILHHLLEGIDHSLTDGQVWQLATNTHGYVGADLASLCNEAALVCLKRSFTFTGLNFTGLSLDDKKPDLDGAFEATPCSDSECSSNFNNQDLSGEHVNNTKDVIMKGSYHCQARFPVVNGTSTEKEGMLKVALSDFEKARIKVRPSAMREVILEVPKVSWKDVGGQDEVKTQLMEAVLWPQKHQDAFKRIGTHPPSGILLFGPPGCSKTLLARAVASEAGLNFLAVKGPELFSKWVGESEKAVKSLFAKARANAPAIIFFDEIDGLAVIRGKENDGVSVSDRVMSQLLVELDGLHERVNVTVIAATNRPDKIDSALLRPGRFDRLLYVGPPNEIDREAIFHIHLRKTPLTTDVNIKELAALTAGYTGADISLVCREAGLAALEENIDASSISMSHFRAAINQVTPLENQSYQNLSARFQRLVGSSQR